MRRGVTFGLVLGGGAYWSLTRDMWATGDALTGHISIAGRRIAQEQGTPLSPSVPSPAFVRGRP